MNARQARFLRAFNRALDDPRWWRADPECGRVFDFTGWLDRRYDRVAAAVGWRHRRGMARR